MRALLDANVLIALLGADHSLHARASDLHQFWPDDIGLLDPRVADAGHIHGPRQLTDAYLLALAVRHRGRFVTFDASIAFEAVRGAQKQHLLTL